MDKMKISGKALELQRKIDQVRDAWRAQLAKPSVPGGESPWYSIRVFEDPDLAVVELPEGLYAYPYTLEEDGCTFDEPYEVEFSIQRKGEDKSLAVKASEGTEAGGLDMTVKFLGETKDAYRVGGYGVVWGSEEQRDLSPWKNEDGSQGEFFRPDTQGLEDLPVKVLTFEHDKEIGPDGQPFTDALGKSVLERNDLIGRWVEALVEKRRRYAGYVVDLVKRGLLNFSSETAAHWREVADNGEIKRWRTAGYTLTTHPMEPRLTGVGSLAKSFKSVGLELAEPTTGGAEAGASGLEMAKAKARTLQIISRLKQMEV